LEVYLDKYNQYPDNSVYGGTDYNRFGYWWDSSCGGDNPNDEFLTALKDEGIMLTIPDDPSHTTQQNCYLYSAATVLSGYDNRYFLLMLMEDGDNIQSIGCVGSDIALRPNNSCFSQQHD